MPGQVYVHRLRRYLGAYLVQLGHVDAIIFSAGIGENAAEIRRLTLAGMQAPPRMPLARMPSGCCRSPAAALTECSLLLHNCFMHEPASAASALMLGVCYFCLFLSHYPSPHMHTLCEAGVLHCMPRLAALCVMHTIQHVSVGPHACLSTQVG